MMGGVSMKRAIDHVPRVVKDHGGFTLVEVLITVMILSLGIVAVISSVSVGVKGVDRGRKSTTALFLSEQRMEQVKAFAVSKNPLQGWANVAAATFPAEAYGTIAGYPEYRRTVTITNNPAGVVNTKQVEVWVYYRPITSGVNGLENGVTTATLLVAR
jgi:prepilin-type N-terminal cleavage/methylation domain-containing protein